VRSVFADHKPFLVFHAAAYKHVPMMEENPEEAVRNNVLGTLITARAAEEAGVSRFVFISTDKAVDPISVMGKTKRAGELIVRALSGTGKTRFMSVRFGNVMGSRGSVIESFQKQIEAGGPVTVTHVQMERFFMLTSEAVLLVLQAAALGSGGETFILDMGKPIRIMDLASEMIRLAGLEPERDIKIKITGVRPGERLSERLHFEDEILGPTPHPKVFVAKQSGALLGQSILSALDAYTEGRIESAPTVFLDQIITSGGVPSSHT
jgi:FlaA1/EpsC-like NDP-sugar epimerase